MLTVGMYGKGHNKEVLAGDCTDEEYRVHFTLWCMLSAPLMIGCDVRTMSKTAKEILTSREVLAVNQDPLGAQGRSIGDNGNKSQVWAKILADGSLAVALFNLHDTNERLMSLAWNALNLHDRRPALVRDLWAKENIGVHARDFSVRVKPHTCLLFRVSPQVMPEQPHPCSAR